MVPQTLKFVSSIHEEVYLGRHKSSPVETSYFYGKTGFPSKCSMICLGMMLKKWHALNSIPAFTFLYSSSAVNVLEKGCILRLARTFLESDVVDYSKLTLDTNPLHFDPKCAKDAGFTDRLVPGMLVASVFPRVIASYFVSSCFLPRISLLLHHPRFTGLCFWCCNVARSSLCFTKFAFQDPSLYQRGDQC